MSVAATAAGRALAPPSFVPFYTTKEGGAGIGLALARQIALAHGGRLTAAPNGSRGMTFVLSIPASQGG